MMTLVSVETFQNRDVGGSLGDFIYLQEPIGSYDVRLLTDIQMSVKS